MKFLFFSIILIIQITFPLKIENIKGTVQYQSPLLGNGWNTVFDTRDISDISKIRTSSKSSCVISSSTARVNVNEKTIVVFISAESLSIFKGKIKISSDQENFTVNTINNNILLHQSITCINTYNNKLEICNFLNSCEVTTSKHQAKNTKINLGPYQKVLLTQKITALEPIMITENDLKDWNINIKIEESKLNDFYVFEAKAKYYLENNNFNQASKNLSIAKLLFPSEWRTYLLYGQMYYQLKDYSNAEKYYSIADDLGQSQTAKMYLILIRKKLYQ